MKRLCFSALVAAQFIPLALCQKIFPTDLALPEAKPPVIQPVQIIGNQRVEGRIGRHTFFCAPVVRKPEAEPPKVNLLVDIQAKLQAGKGAGYARWAKVFNLKQMAQTMNYLSENKLLEYAVLEEKAAAATAHHNELSAHIKAAEKRMAEIAVLRTHIVNYAKTREVYVAYRKAGYSKKFREAHEEEILLHQAAKNAFDEMGVKKLPKVKELQTEYAKLLEEKKKTYSEYRRSREEMRELLTAKANVDRVLKMEVEQDVEKEKDHGQR